MRCGSCDLLLLLLLLILLLLCNRSSHHRRPHHRLFSNLTLPTPHPFCTPFIVHPPSSIHPPHTPTHPILTPSSPHQAEEDYDSKLPDGSRITTKRTTTTHWTFRGCVSGQQALDWEITGFNGFGFQ